MILYQRKTLSTGASVGSPDVLPINLEGMQDQSGGLDVLADLPAHFGVDTLTQLGLLDAGFLPVEIPVPVPEIVSDMQLRRQLLTMPRTDGVSDGTKLLDQIDTGIHASGDRDLILYWERTSEFHRHHPKVEAMLSVFNITDPEADAAWIAASQLN